MIGHVIDVTIDGEEHKAAVGNYYDGVLCFYVDSIDQYFRIYDFRDDYDIWVSVVGEGDLINLSFSDLEKHKPFVFYNGDYGMNFTRVTDN